MPADSEDEADLLYCNFLLTLNNTADHRIVTPRDKSAVTTELETGGNSETATIEPRRKATPRRRRPHRSKPRATAIPVPTPDSSIPKNQARKRPKQPVTMRDKSPDEPEEKREKTCLESCCSICLENLGSKPLASTKCGHIFCHECLKRALKRKAICPNCRKPLRGPSAWHPIFLQ